MVPPKPGLLCRPPADLNARALRLVACRNALTRVHRIAEDPAFWGKTRANRFDAPRDEFGVLYASEDEHGAFIETYGDTGTRVVTTTSLGLRGWARVTPNRDLRLVDLSGAGLAHIGADERLCSGEHEIAQQWSLALWLHPAAIDGLYYRARHDPSRMSVALFDRAAVAVAITRNGGLLEGRALLASILDTYQIALL
jgi:hypothetical protein